ncbi:hypothetical protein CTheo_7803 [Ceratobasidium theobromae]|uniref:TAFII28-like protein domain-containing protein n=1 Tax=Ceratobasidium theobromae TaxID=1582974 RepID=A0A5N5QAU5_9AGAM|nr:hypothetical protein CTheo_7803 [Ceratobasidium theobromae]
MGTVSSILEQAFPQAPQWSVDQMPDLTGQVMLVTGGNTGIGRETCKSLLNKNARVYMACRCPKRAKDAVEWLKEATGGKEAIFLHLDLADLESVRAAATEFTRRETRLHCLINNGGVFGPPISDKTVQGYDLQFGTNVLGHFLFTKLLLPTMIRTVDTSLGSGTVRIVNVSSVKHLFAPRGGVDYDSLEPNSVSADHIRGRLGLDKLYAQSKWALVAFSNELARRYGDEGIVSISLHPGNIRTEIARHIPMSSMMTAIADMVLWDCSYGALTQLYAATDPAAAELNGKYLVPWARLDGPRHDTFDLVGRQKLWDWLEVHSSRGSCIDGLMNVTAMMYCPMSGLPSARLLYTPKTKRMIGLKYQVTFLNFKETLNIRIHISLSLGITEVKNINTHVEGVDPIHVHKMYHINASMLEPTANSPVNKLEEDSASFRSQKRKATNVDDIDVDAELEAAPSSSYLKRGRTGTAEAASRAGSMAPPGAAAAADGDGDDDDDEAPAMADDDYSAQLSWQSQSKENMKLLLGSFTPDQLARYETYRRSTLNKQSVRRSLGANVSVNVAQVIAGFSKVFVGEIIELARHVQQQSLPPGAAPGPLSPDHLRAAYQLYIQQTGHVGSAKPARGRRLFVR